MGRDCKFCGAYISSDMADVCPACGKRSRPEKESEAEHWTGSYRAGAAAQAAPPEREQRSGPSENQAYTYKQEYERRYGSQPGSGTGTTRRPGQQAPPRGASGQRSYDYQSAQTPRYNAASRGFSDEDEDIRCNRGISYLSYFGPLFLIPFLARHDSEFARFHSNQGLLLLLANIAVNTCSELPIIGWMIRIIGTLFVLSGFINGLINVSRGEKKPLPVIGGINIIK